VIRFIEDFQPLSVEITRRVVPHRSRTGVPDNLRPPLGTFRKGGFEPFASPSAYPMDDDRKRSRDEVRFFLVSNFSSSNTSTMPLGIRSGP
jgi:hypothetical protein